MTPTFNFFAILKLLGEAWVILLALVLLTLIHCNKILRNFIDSTHRRRANDQQFQPIAVGGK